MATNFLGASKGAGVPCPRTTNTTTHQRARLKPMLSTGSPRLPLHAGNRPSSAPLSYSRRAPANKAHINMNPLENTVARTATKASFIGRLREERFLLNLRAPFAGGHFFSRKRQKASNRTTCERIQKFVLALVYP